MTILREKVAISRILWLTVAIVVAGCLANTVVVQKGGETMRVYDLWLSVFRPSSYAGVGIAEVVVGFGEIAFFTLIVFSISALVGWLISAIFGSCVVLLRKRK